MTQPLGLLPGACAAACSESVFSGSRGLGKSARLFCRCLSSPVLLFLAQQVRGPATNSTGLTTTLILLDKLTQVAAE